MTDSPGRHDFVYMDTDIPTGMTIREWHAERSAARVAMRAAARAARRRRRARNLRRWLGVSHVSAPRLRPRSREAVG